MADLAGHYVPRGEREMMPPHLRSDDKGYGPVPTSEKKDDKPAQGRKDKMKKRKMTDVWCGCIFFIFMIGYLTVTVRAFNRGDPRRLYHGFDYQGRLCGVDEAVHDKTLMYWPDPNRMELMMCVADCPGDSNGKITVPLEDVATSSGKNYNRTEIMRTEEQVPTYTSRKVGGRLCVPVGGTSRLMNVTRRIVDEQDVLFTTFKDLTNAWCLLLLIIPFSLMISYAYLFIIRSCAKYLLLGVTFLLLAASGLVAWVCFQYIGDDIGRAQRLVGRYVDDPVQRVNTIGYTASFIAAILLIGICYLMWSHQSMEKDVACVEAASEAMWQVQFVLSMPLLELVVKFLFTIVWMFCFAYVITSGEIAANQVTVNGHFVEGLTKRYYLVWWPTGFGVVIYLVGWVWIMSSITMIFKFAVSYVMASWYFTARRQDLSKPEVEPETWKQGFWWAFTKHLGSVVLGAFLLTLFGLYRPIHFVVRNCMDRAQKQTTHTGKAIVECCECCTTCVQEVVRYVDRNAVAEMVLNGDCDFFQAAHNAAQAMDKFDKENKELSLSGLSNSTWPYQTLGLALTAAAGAGITQFVTRNINIYTARESEYYLENRMGVTIVASLVAILVCQVFMFLLDLTTNTMLYCWLVEGNDEKKLNPHQSQRHNTFAPKTLRNLIFNKKPETLLKPDEKGRDKDHAHSPDRSTRHDDRHKRDDRSNFEPYHDYHSHDSYNRNHSSSGWAHDR